MRLYKIGILLVFFAVFLMLSSISMAEEIRVEGKVFCDTDGNGEIGVNDELLTGVVVEITAPVSGVSATATTNPGFRIPIADEIGEYTVAILSPANQQIIIGSSFENTGGQNQPGYEILLRGELCSEPEPEPETGEIRVEGKVFCDTDGNGEITNEVPLNGVEVRITDPSGDSVTETTGNPFVDAFHITLPGGEIGEYTVEIVSPAGQLIIIGNSFTTTTVGEDQAGFNILLDGEFCSEEQLPHSCCEDGKPTGITMQYTGEDCAATSHNQDPRKVKCQGDPAFASLVYIIASDKKLDDSKAKIFFEGVVALNESFDIDAATGGANELKAETRVSIFNEDGNGGQGNTLLQCARFHTSCSQPLNTGDQFGSLLLEDCGGDNGPGGGGNETCDTGKPAILTMLYTGEDCDASSNSQDPGKLECEGDPAGAFNVYIIATDKENPDDKKAKIFFEGGVIINNVFDIDAANAGENKLKANTWVHILNSQGGTNLQSVKFHTSCSQPLNIGDVFGSLELVVFTPE